MNPHDEDSLKDGKRIRVPMMLADGKPAPAGNAVIDGLPPGVTILADGSAKHVFPDGSSVVMSQDRTVMFLNAAGYMSRSLTDHQYLFLAQSAGGGEGRQKALDGIVDARAQHLVMTAELASAWSRPANGGRNHG